jgi:hypothetical protein
MAHSGEVNTQALARGRELKGVADAAPDGAVLAQAETVPCGSDASSSVALGKRRYRRRPTPLKKGGAWPRLSLRPPPLRQGRGRQDHGDVGRFGAAVSAVVPLSRLRRLRLSAGRAFGIGEFPQRPSDAAGLPGRGQLVVRRGGRASGRVGGGRR